jgi:hypothetical protein
VLQIVSDELWDAVKARQAEVRIVMTRDADGNTSNGAHRRQYLPSGLLESWSVRRRLHHHRRREVRASTPRSTGFIRRPDGGPQSASALSRSA